MRYNKERVDKLLTMDKTPEVLDELIALNYGLLMKQLGKFYLHNDADALSYGYEALYNAINTFDGAKNSSLSTYATICIYNRLGSYVRTLNNCINTNTMSYETPVGEDDLVILDTLESPHTADAALLSQVGINNVRLAADRSIAEVTNPLHRAIVATWVESDYTETHSSIAARLNCTQSYVSQVIKKFKNVLKNKLEEIEND